MVVCRQLGCGTALSAPLSAHFGEGSGPIWLDDVACSGRESSLTDCGHGEFGQHDCDHSDDAGVVCSGDDIRLAGSRSTRCSGRVEIYHDQTWGTVCDDSWDLNDANLVCRQLGCGTALSAPRWAHFGAGSGPIWLDDVACSREESSFSDCGHGGFGQHDCDHSDDAGVVCSAASAPNVAPTGTASQSTTYSYLSPRLGRLLVANASLAIDGNKNPEHYDGSCTHTSHAYTHWWSLLLPAVYRITHISITNRMLFTQRINDAQILIGTSTENNGNNNPRCDGVYGINPGATRTFNCGGMIGQMVTVNLKGSNSALSMCELEVYGGK
ncbi:deleted in malignant brain tumors 1 protein-like [Notolabrus celidotus]|uniref:deleted in malignant brain tumors 1 protein-like n=1 Tax=Notolabrus celidotus TaxID=1203425 RepID=UPI00149060B8|nr:deleted in malignant brain tumors 1 protein-like [Notolabrus celidotus]